VWWSETQGSGLAFHNHLVLSNISSATECQQECLQLVDFLCRSVDWYPELQQCALSRYRLSDAPDYVLPFEANVTHYNWFCQNGEWRN
jgi:hypothetical protein